jgi:enoyl-CoA hydratase/carnithine racemase
MASEELIYEVEDGIGRATFNRPEARNALTFAMYDRLAEICSGIRIGGPVNVLILTGAGDKAFAAGTDISQFRAFKTPEQGIAYEQRADEIFSAIEACPVPIIAAIAGACTGGGAGIAACCDIRLATKDLRYGFPIARTLGNCLSAATLRRLVAVVGHAAVGDMIYTARLIEAAEARSIGLVSEVLADHASLMTHAEELARRIKEHAPLTMRVTKQLLRQIRDSANPVDDRALIAEIYTSADFREGMDAFLGKRKPTWQGK